MNRKNIRFKLGIGAKLLGYRRTAVWVWENDGGKGFFSLPAFVFVLAGITACPLKGLVFHSRNSTESGYLVTRSQL